MLFPFLTIFLIIILFLAYRYRTLDKKQQEITDAFWDRERKANTVVAADISDLPYLTVPLDKFPIGVNQDEAIVNLEEKLKEAAKLPMLNLSHMSNTELKETYGVPNLAHMQEVGENYNNFSILLKDYAAALTGLEQYQNALPVLEYAAGTKSDISQIYKMLGDCYARCNQAHKIPYLAEQAKNAHLVLESSVLAYLNELAEAANGPREDFPV